MTVSNTYLDITIIRSYKVPNAIYMTYEISMDWVAAFPTRNSPLVNVKTPSTRSPLSCQFTFMAPTKKQMAPPVIQTQILNFGHLWIWNTFELTSGCAKLNKLPVSNIGSPYFLLLRQINKFTTVIIYDFGLFHVQNYNSICICSFFILI